jgi:hypothetical protein
MAIRSDLRYLGFGMAGGMLAAGALILAVLSVRREVPALPSTALPSPPAARPSEALASPSSPPSPTAPPTLTPSATSVPSVTPTLTEIEWLRASGALFVTGALTEAQQIRLYEASLKYIARTPQDGRRVAQEINGVEYGYADNTCGPLSMAILRDAGLVSAGIVPHDYWLLNPFLASDRQFLLDTLPPEHFKHLVFHDWMRDFDWQEFPLLPGDFIYIHAGGGGNFDHMLVVTRVDDGLRAYSVTNYRGPDGFVIDEVLLYDPRDPDVGIFDVWSGRAQAPSGSTGFGGFEVWRPLGGGGW